MLYYPRKRYAISRDFSYLLTCTVQTYLTEHECQTLTLVAGEAKRCCTAADSMSFTVGREAIRTSFSAQGRSGLLGVEEEEVWSTILPSEGVEKLEEKVAVEVE